MIPFQVMALSVTIHFSSAQGRVGIGRLGGRRALPRGTLGS